MGRNIKNYRSDTAIYFEWKPDNDRPYTLYFNAASGTTPPDDYEVHKSSVLRPDHYTVSFYVDDTLWQTQLLSYYGGVSTPYVCWEGEIRGRETDMPGLLNDKCTFYNCGCALTPDTIPHPVNFSNSWASGDTIGVTRQLGKRPNEWGARSFLTSSFVIWDVNPYVP
jgi:hypothetical protein